jgi:SAM-dependent methyltransferase
MKRRDRAALARPTGEVLSFGRAAGGMAEPASGSAGARGGAEEKPKKRGQDCLRSVSRDYAYDRIPTPQEIELIAKCAGTRRIVAWFDVFDLSQPLDDSIGSEEAIAIIRKVALKRMSSALPVIREFEYVKPGSGLVNYYQDLNDVRARIWQDLKIDNVRNWLDIGTGYGCFAVEAARRLSSGRVFTFDISFLEAIAASRQESTQDCRNIVYLTADAYAPCFASASFDGAGTFMGIQDICATTTELTRLFKTVAGLLVPGSQFVLAVGTPEDAETESQRFGIEIYRYIRAGFFAKAAIADALSEAGFQWMQERYYDTGVNLNPDGVRQLIQFECDWWVENLNLPTVTWQKTWERFEPRIRELDGVELDAKITVITARKNK